MAEENLYSKDRHEWAGVNRAVKKDVNLKNYINTEPTVKEKYDAHILQFEAWRVQTFNVQTGVEGVPGKIVGRPLEMFPCTYQEWSGNIPFDVYLTGVGGKKTPVWRRLLALSAKEFRKAVSDAVHAYRAGSNINRTDKVNSRPGEGVNSPQDPV